MWNTERYLERMYEDTKPMYAFAARNKEEWSEWRKDLKQQFIADLGGFPVHPAELSPRIIEETACDGYIRQRVVITTYAGLEMPMYVLKPVGMASDRFPAVIACHGHGYGSKEIAGLLPDGVKPLVEPTYQQQFAVELVKQGVIVCAPEILGFGDRRIASETKNNAQNSCHRIATFLLQMGQSIAGHRVYETLRAIDYLCERPDVDPERIGCMGISGGGLVAGFAAAFDERIQAAAISGYVNTFKASILSIHHCVDNYIPGLNRHAEMPDIIGMIAPRPLLVESGTLDNIFPIAATLKACEQIHGIYRLLGKAENFETDIFEGGHRINGKKAYSWMVRNLSL